MNPKDLATPSSKFTVETIYRIYNKSGSYLEVAPDEDHEDLLMIREIASDGKTVLSTISEEPEKFRMLAEILLKATAPQ